MRSGSLRLLPFGRAGRVLMAYRVFGRLVGVSADLPGRGEAAPSLPR